MLQPLATRAKNPKSAGWILESSDSRARWVLKSARYCWDHSLPNRWGGVVAGPDGPTGFWAWWALQFDGTTYQWDFNGFLVGYGYGGTHCTTFIQTMASWRPCTLGPSLKIPFAIICQLPRPFLCWSSWLHVLRPNFIVHLAFPGNLAPVTVLIVQIQCSNGQTFI